jgi:hypothetical protein
MKDTNRFHLDLAAILRTIVRIGLIGIAAYLVHLSISWIMNFAEGAQNTPLMLGLLFAVLLAYALLISIPFVPGIEIALSLMLIRGPDIVIWVYVATVLGLCISFLAGQYLSYAYLKKVFHDLRLKRACNLIETLQPLSRNDRLSLIKNKLPKVLRPFLVEGRYALVAALINIPGNALIGGGGGILLIAGLSRLYATGWMIFTLMVAVVPIPIAILIFDIDPMAFLREK